MAGLQQTGLINSAMYVQATNTSGTAATLTPVETADAEVRWFKNQANRGPLLIGATSMIVATPADADYYDVNYANRKVSEYWRLPWHCGEGVSAKPTHWFKQPRLLQKDDNITVTGLQTSGADNKVLMVILHTLYGHMPKLSQGAMEQTILPITSSSTTANVWHEAGSVTYLDKDAIYYLLAAVVIGDTAIAVRAKADSFEGAKPVWAGAANQLLGAERMMDIPPFAMRFDGVETLTFEVYDTAGTTTPQIYALLAKEYKDGRSNVPAETTEVSTPGRSVAPLGAPSSGFSIFGGR